VHTSFLGLLKENILKLHKRIAATTGFNGKGVVFIFGPADHEVHDLLF
jgi:hypothetical protein